MSSIYVFDASPLVACCKYSVGNSSVGEMALAGVDARIPGAVYEEVITRGGSRPDAIEAARLIDAGHIQVARSAELGTEPYDLQHYSLGQGEREAITLTATLQPDAVLVTDDFVALVVTLRLGLP